MEETIDHGIYASPKPENETRLPGDAFRSEQINFLQSKIELVRNRFVYQNLAYESTHEITLSDGYLIKNRWIIRILSIAVIYLTGWFILFGWSASGGMNRWNFAQFFNKGALISLWGPLFIILGASLALYQSFIRSTVAKIKTTDAAYTVRIKTLEENKTLDQLKMFLKEKELVVLDNRKVHADRTQK